MPTPKPQRRGRDPASEPPAGKVVGDRPTIADPRRRSCSSLQGVKRRGAQPANQNARKTGLYSKLVTVQDDVDAASMPRDMSDDELALARIRLKELILQQRQAPPQNWLSFEKAIQHYIDRIANITYKNAILGRQQGAAFTTVMEMIRQANEEQGVA